jgi:hypothetical protein
VIRRGFGLAKAIDTVEIFVFAAGSFRSSAEADFYSYIVVCQYLCAFLALVRRQQTIGETWAIRNLPAHQPFRHN